MRSQDIAFEVEHTNVTKYFETCTPCTVLYTVHRVHWVLKQGNSHKSTLAVTKIW